MVWKTIIRRHIFLYFTSLKIDLTIPVIYCPAERAFLKLTKIKNKYSSSQTQENLNVQMIFYLENGLLD